MSARTPISLEPEHPRHKKRRKLELSSNVLQLSSAAHTMGPQELGSNPPLELTETEAKLRQLLLDVAEYSERQPPGILKSSIPHELSRTATVIRFTGGWVRDKLLGVDSQDIDVAINNMTGYQFGLKLKQFLEEEGNAEKYGIGRTVPADGQNSRGSKPDYGLHKILANPEKSKHLETVTTKIFNLDIDLVNLRKETYTEDSRNPQMEFGTPEEDARRRDATVNAMFYNLNTSQIEDLTGQGFQDMAAKIIRTPLEPYQTFKDDPLRVLRLIRFATRLGYKIDPMAEDAMRNPEIREALKLKISRERIGIEVEKMLKGPDPYGAAVLIDRLDLYLTIFTDPTKQHDYRPHMDLLEPARACLSRINESDLAETYLPIRLVLIQNAEDSYVAWLLAFMIPYANASPVFTKRKSKPYYLSELVIREGVKAPNKICELIAAASRNLGEISGLVQDFSEHAKHTSQSPRGKDPTARDTLGMAIRQWGPSWRSQVLFSMLYEVASDASSESSKYIFVKGAKIFMSNCFQAIMAKYSKFLDHVSQLDLLKAYDFKPLLDGKMLAKALGTSPGPWMRDALDLVMEWQLLHPDVTDTTVVIEALEPSIKSGVERVKNQKNSKAESGANDSKDGAGRSTEGDAGERLRSRITQHVLTLIIRPLFAQTQRPSSISVNARLSRSPSLPEKFRSMNIRDDNSQSWKKKENAYALDLLIWVLRASGPSGVESSWPLIVPPILKMIDEVDVSWKVKGINLINMLFDKISPLLLAKTGLGDVFEEALLPCLTYLPPLTSEKESIALTDQSYPALISLCKIRYPKTSLIGSKSTPSTVPVSDHEIAVTVLNKREKFLDNLVRQGFLKSYFHSSEYVQLTSVLLRHLRSILQTLGIPSVKHLGATLPLISNILSEPLGPVYPSLLAEAAKTIQVIITSAWPRILYHKGEILNGVCVCWIRLCEDTAREEEFRELKGKLKDIVHLLKAVVDAEGKSAKLEKDFESLIKANGILVGLLQSP